MNGLSKFIASLAALLGVMAAITAVLYKITKKRLKIKVEVLPDNIEDENELTAAVDVVDMDIPDYNERKNNSEPEFEVSFTETPDEE